MIVSDVVSHISAEEARSLVSESKALGSDYALFNSAVSAKIFAAAKVGQTELHYAFAGVPTSLVLEIARQLQASGFQAHVDDMGGVVRWQ